MLYHNQTAENKGVTESHNFLVEKDKPAAAQRPDSPFSPLFLCLFAETNNKSIENYKYFSEAVRYNEVKLSAPKGGYLKW
ncbi:MAG: hypothetical protein KHY26_06205 [Faecalibacterium prausnitzii]|nr:hypothetical protein [Faecalibacterium prausnitzii]